MNRKCIYTKNEGFTVRALGDETLFLDPRGNAIHVANEVGGFIYELVDGKRTAGDILAEICRDYEIDENTAERDLEDFFRVMTERDILAKPL